MDSLKTQQTQGQYNFGAFRLDVSDRRLWCDNEPISLTPKRFDLLFYFVENAGRVINKNELLDAIWTDTFVEESTLARNVSSLRKKLEKSDYNGTIIETVSKIGYRFVPEVEYVADDDETTFIVEEQIAQHFRGEEIITLDDDYFAERKGEREMGRKGDGENKVAVLPNVAPLPLRPFAPSPFLLAAFALIALVGSGFVIYQNYFKADIQTADTNADAKTIVKKIRIDSNRENVYSEIQVLPGDLIDISTEGGYQRETGKIWSFQGDKNDEVTADLAFQNADPWSLVGWIGTETDHNNYFQVSKTNSITADRSGFLYFAVNDLKNKYSANRGGPIVTVTVTRPAGIEKKQIKIGSVVNLQNRTSDESSYLDAWGIVRNKSEFSRVPTEEMFVSTHKNPNRDNGSGSWEIVPANGKKSGDALVYGDKIHLKNMYPDAGYLDTCGWIKHLPVFKDFADQTTAVFTTESKDRDFGTGVWIIKSKNGAEGIPVFEGDDILLLSDFPGAGFLNTGELVSNIPTYSDYDGLRLVFTLESSVDKLPDSSNWTIYRTCLQFNEKSFLLE